MPTTVTILAGVGLLLVGAGQTVRTYLEYRSSNDEPERTRSPSLPSTADHRVVTDGGKSPTATQAVLDEERLRAHREIMEAVIQLNRRVVEMDATELREEADILAHGGDSELDDPHAEVTETYQSYFYIISPEVREAVSEYADYLVTFHDDGAQAGDLLSLSGAVAETMREDFGLQPLFRGDQEDTIEDSSVAGSEGDEQEN